MTYKTILAILQGKADSGRVLDCAVPLAARFSAHLIGFHAEPTAMPYVTPMGFPDTEFLIANEEANEQRVGEIRALFEARAGREGVSHGWHSTRSVSGDSAVSALSVARASDLIVVQQADPEADQGVLGDVETLLFEWPPGAAGALRDLGQLRVSQGAGGVERLAAGRARHVRRAAFHSRG